MREGEHTQGPWAASTDGVGWLITTDADPAYIAVVEIPRCPSKQPQAHANARLIAAAPDLLAMCLRLLANYRAIRDDELVPDSLNEDQDWIDLEAAIDKATKTPS